MANAPASYRPRNAPTPFDLESMFIVHRGNLAVVHEAQFLIADAGHDLVRTYGRHLEAMLAETRTGEMAMSGEMAARVMGAVGRSLAVGTAVAGLSLEVIGRVGDLLARRAWANLDELRSFGA